MSCVSLIVPCFNQAATLERAVISAEKQSALCELIIVNDCSNDDFDACAGKLTAGRSWIRTVTADCNLGPGGARNRGAYLAKGEYLCFLDADDELVGDFFGEALALMGSRDDMHVVKGEMEFFDPVKGYILPVFDPRHASAVLSSSCGMIIEARAFSQIGGFPEESVFRGPNGGEDVALMEVVMKYLQPVGRIGRPCYKVWSRAGSHVDRFLASTRLTADGFEFVSSISDQQAANQVSQALAAYVERVGPRMRRDTEVNPI